MDKIVRFEKKLKLHLKNKSLLMQALTHKSANMNKNNERLEFLGDRVLGLVLANKLLELYPHESEGIMDKKFAKLVNRETCSSIAWSMGIQNFIILGDTKKKINEKDEKILSDACEALIGAVYLDRGFNFANAFVLRLWEKDLGKSYVTVLDSKTKLQEYSLKHFKKLPVYKYLSSRGPRHNPTFKISVSIFGSKQFIGIGKSKQQAEQNGANNLLQSMNII